MPFTPEDDALDKLPTRADVSPTLHPGSLAPHASVFDPVGSGPHPFLSAREALASLHNWSAAVGDARERLLAVPKGQRLVHAIDGSSVFLGDLRMTPSGRRVFSGHEEELAAAADKSFERAARLVRDRLKSMRHRMEEHSAAVEAALTYDGAASARGVAQAQEMRTLLRAVPESERTTAVINVIERGSEREARQMADVVLHAPSFLSPLKPDAVAAVRAVAERRLAHAEVMRRDTILQMIGHVERALSIAEESRKELHNMVPGGGSRDALARLEAT